MAAARGRRVWPPGQREPRNRGSRRHSPRRAGPCALVGVHRGHLHNAPAAGAVTTWLQMKKLRPPGGGWLRQPHVGAERTAGPTQIQGRLVPRPTVPRIRYDPRAAKRATGRVPLGERVPSDLPRDPKTKVRNVVAPQTPASRPPRAQGALLSAREAVPGVPHPTLAL